MKAATVQDMINLLSKVKDKQKMFLLPSSLGGEVHDVYLMENEYGVTLFKDGIPRMLREQMPKEWSLIQGA
jgi:hypothetical protein